MSLLGATRDRLATMRPAAVAVIAVAVGALIWLLFIRGDGDEGEPGTGSGLGPSTAVSADELSRLSEQRGQPIYWAGNRPGTTTTLTESDSGNVFVSYAADGSDAPPLEQLTVGTYPFPSAFSTLETLAEAEGTNKVSLARGGIAYFTEANPQSVYFAYPDLEYQIEVYDPDPKEALELVTTGKVVAVP